MTVMPDFRLAYRPFPEQQAFFRRKISVPSARWDDLMLGDHAHGFMVAGVTREAVLADIRAAIEAAIANGETLADFRKRFNQIIATHGWPGGAGNESAARRAWRTRVIYQTNLRTSYMAGRWEHLKTFPYLRYQHNAVANPREQHLAWDGVVLATDNPWWDTHYTPNGWGCRCTITGVSRARLAQLGKTEPDPTPAPVTGDPPPEWAYHVGKAARSLPAAQRLGAVVAQLPPAWRSIALADAQQRVVDWYADHVAAWNALQIGRPNGRTLGAGHLTPAAFDFMASRSSPPASTLIAVSDAEIAHLLRDTKTAAGRALPDDFLRELPVRLAKPDAVLFDTQDAALVYAWRLPDGRVAKVVIRTDFRRKGVLQRLPANWIRTAGIVPANNLKGERYQLVEGAL